MGKAFLGELPSEEDVLPEDPRRALMGRVGVARTKMLPSGAVEIDGQMIDAVTQGQAIEPGTYVVVSEVRANRVVVRPAGKDQRPSHENPNDRAVATDRGAGDRVAGRSAGVSRCREPSGTCCPRTVSEYASRYATCDCPPRLGGPTRAA